MKKINLLKILIPGLVVIFGLSQTNILANIKSGHSNAQANGGLTIDWGVPVGQPLFNVPNFLPGDKAEKEITIVNETAVVQPIGVRGIKTTEIGALPTVLDFTISTNSTDLYGGTAGVKTLTQFFNDSLSPDGLFLFNLNPSESKKVKFLVKFSESAGNEFQKTSVIFDLVIGASSSVPEIPQECRHLRFDKIIYGTSGKDNLRGTNGNDLIYGLEGNDDINGSNGDDCLIGGPGKDSINGSNGNDIILGGEGDDKIDGSNGNDLIMGGEGDDVINGSNGEDRIFGNEGNDKIYGGNGNDYIEAGSGNDFVDGGNSDDKIFGQEGNDQLFGGNGADYCEGGEGNDTLTGGNGNDVLLGGSGNDSAKGDLGVDRCEAEVKKTCEL